MKRWIYSEEPENLTVEDLSQQLNINKTLAKLLVMRGVVTFEGAKQYFRPSLEHLHDPLLMKDMDKAVERLGRAIQEKENILIYGDYDVDGTTSVSLMVRFLRNLTDHIQYYIPDRDTEGYGISDQGIEWAHEHDYSLIISVDCGIKAVDKIQKAKDYAIDFIVCDHHTPGEVLPPAIAVLDPKVEGCNYPYKELSGCGIAFKLLQGLCEVNKWNTEGLFSMLDLVAVSIAADIVPLTGENRTLCQLGMEVLKDSKNVGIKALLNMAAIKEINITSIVFGLAPRINAAGRMDHASQAVEMLLTTSKHAATTIVAQIEKHNNMRRSFDLSIRDQALSTIKKDQTLISRKTTVLYNPEWHKGVVGIVASRCIETYYRPTIILTKSQGKVTGSARSVPGYNVYNAIDECAHLLEKFGGHKYAAGLTMKEENVQSFMDQFEAVVAKTIDDELLIPRQNIDTSLSFDEIDKKFINILNQMAPHGPGNNSPVFEAKNVYVCGKIKIMKESHIKFEAAQEGSNQRFEAVGWDMADYGKDIERNRKMTLAFSLSE
ncbi:MAG: single-stranded-DNA-specific exonuclease RecJ, partial [Cyclobacteriaceae bacterium]|nr:single-stranded-DNA-specific exonuclease RecJ [Cyclobacteriaceae bacterium]